MPDRPLSDIIGDTPDLDAAAAGWSVPIRLDSTTLKPFPADLLPGALGDFVRALAASTGTPLELPTMAVLAVVAACLAKRYEVELAPGYAEPLNLWTMVALPPGNRKSAVVKAATAPIVAWQHEQARRSESRRAAASISRQVAESRLENLKARARSCPEAELPALIAELVAAQAALPELARTTRILAGDVTPEQLAVLLAENGERLAIISDEGGIFGTVAGRYQRGMVNADVLLQAHAGSAVDVDRKSHGAISLRSPALTMFLTPQPVVLREIPASLRERGLLDRFLVALPASLVGFRDPDPAPLPADVQEAYTALVGRLLGSGPEADEHGGPRTLGLDPDAKRAWSEFAHLVEVAQRPEGTLEFVQGWASKLPGAVARIVGAFHVVAHVDGRPEDYPVSGETMGAAIRVGAAMIPHALATYDLLGADQALDDARHVWAWLDRNQAREFSASELFNKLRGRFKTMAPLEKAIGVLCERHYVRRLEEVARTGPGRRPSPRYRVSPFLAEEWA